MLPPVDRLQSCRGCHLSDCHSVVQLSFCRVARARDAAVGRPSSTSSPEEKWGALSYSRERCWGENRCDRGRTLPEYFTDDLVVVKTVVIRDLAIKSHAGVARRRRPRPESVVVPLYSLLFPVSDCPRSERGTTPRPPIQTAAASLHSCCSRNSPDEYTECEGRDIDSTKNNVISDSVKKFQRKLL